MKRPLLSVLEDKVMRFPGQGAHQQSPWSPTAGKTAEIYAKGLAIAVEGLESQLFRSVLGSEAVEVLWPGLRHRATTMWTLCSSNLPWKPS